MSASYVRLTTQLLELVGFAGSLGHGTANLYSGEYHLPNLARQHFMSNMVRR